MRNSSEATVHLDILLNLTSVHCHPVNWLRSCLHLVHHHLCSDPASIWSITISAFGLLHCHHPVHCSDVQAHLITLITASEHLIPYICVHPLVHRIFPSRYKMDILIFYVVVPPLNLQGTQMCPGG